MKSVGHLVHRYLFLTGSWIYYQLTNLRSFRPFVLTTELENLAEFPLDAVYHYEEPFSGPGKLRLGLRRAYEAVSHRLEDFYISRIREEKAVLLHAHFGTEAYYRLPVVRRTDLPLITTFYGADASKAPVQRPKWRARYQHLFDVGTCFVAEGPHMARTLVDLGCPPRKVRVNHLGVDLHRIPFVLRSRKENEPVNIVFAASFREKKGHVFGVEAFARAVKRFPQMRLRLIGGARTPEEQSILRQCEEIVAREGVSDAVDFLGYLSYGGYLREMHNGHLFLAPSVHASNGDTEGGAPVSITEASAGGMPVIATTHCDIPEVVINETSGVLVPERDIDTLADAILEVATAPETWEVMGRAGRAHVEEEFDIVKQVALLEKIYHDVLETEIHKTEFR